jgi:acetoin utilization deacetylase AcuC-like enzyme
LLVATHEICHLHDPGYHHPERADRLDAVTHGIREAGLLDAITWVEAPAADRAHLESVHPSRLLDRLEEMSLVGGGRIDADTAVSGESSEAARRAAGAGLDLITRLERGEGAIGWSVVRPPGHHATATQQMGFCLLNNVAIAARALSGRGERVLVVDVDAHHGNGTQEIFYTDPEVLFVSFHQYPWFPYTGRPDEVGEGPGAYTNINVALPAGSTGQAFLYGIDTVVGPIVEAFAPTWLLVSLGFDGHRADPITDLGLTSGDYADIVAALLPFAPPGRRLLFLEGGYDLKALADSASAVTAAIVGERHRPEPSTSDGPGEEAVDVARRIHLEQRSN